MVKGPMVHVRMAQVDHYEAKAISCNRQRNILKLIAGHIWYPKVSMNRNDMRSNDTWYV